MRQVSLFESPVSLTSDRIGGHEGRPIGTLQIISTLNKFRRNPQFFALSPDEVMRQGLTPTMQKRYLFWLRAFKLVDEGGKGQYYLTPLAKKLLDPQEGLDPYLESTDSLWYLHWQLLKPTCNLPIFYCAFNHLYQPEFKLSRLQQEAIDNSQLKQWLKKPTERQVEEELRCLMKMYCDNGGYERESIEAQLDNPWRELRLILIEPGAEVRRKGKDVDWEPTYHINIATNIRGSNKPSAQLIMACCIEYAMRSYSSQGCLMNEGESPSQLRYPISQLSYGIGSPVMVFKLSAGTVEESIDCHPELQATHDANFKPQILIEGNLWELRDRLLQDCLQGHTMVSGRASL